MESDGTGQGDPNHQTSRSGDLGVGNPGIRLNPGIFGPFQTVAAAPFPKNWEILGQSGKNFGPLDMVVHESVFRQN